MKSLRLLYLLGIAFLSASYSVSAQTTAIKVDQVGYIPRARKVALIVSDASISDFSIRRIADNKIVFKGKLTPPAFDPDAGENVRAADFTPLSKVGKFYLEVSGVGKSWDFAIAPNVYSRAYYLSMRSFYGQRCGTAIDMGAEFPGYKHAACHLKGAYHSSSGKTGAQQSAKGWHDAGDYGRYIVNSGITTGTLLWTWELFGERLKGVSLNIPESGDSTPDILDEIRWNLEWMLSMQDADGGVWHKQTSEQFCAFVMPEEDTLTSYVIGTGAQPFKNSCATADFAAVMAIAPARINLMTRRLPRARLTHRVGHGRGSMRIRVWRFVIPQESVRANTATPIAATKFCGLQANCGAPPEKKLTDVILRKTSVPTAIRCDPSRRRHGQAWRRWRCGVTQWATAKTRLLRRYDVIHLPPLMQSSNDLLIILISTA
jgi:hypothetical protein